MRLLGAVPKKRRAQTRGKARNDKTLHATLRLGSVDGLICAQRAAPSSYCTAVSVSVSAQARFAARSSATSPSVLYISVPSDVAAMDTTGCEFCSSSGSKRKRVRV